MLCFCCSFVSLDRPNRPPQSPFTCTSSQVSSLPYCQYTPQSPPRTLLHCISYHRRRPPPHSVRLETRCAPCSRYSCRVTHSDLKVASDARMDLLGCGCVVGWYVFWLDQHESGAGSPVLAHALHCTKDATSPRTHPPIQVEYFRSGGADIRIFTSRGASLRTSFSRRSPKPGGAVWFLSWKGRRGKGGVRVMWWYCQLVSERGRTGEHGGAAGEDDLLEEGLAQVQVRLHDAPHQALVHGCCCA